MVKKSNEWDRIQAFHTKLVKARDAFENDINPYKAESEELKEFLNNKLTEIKPRMMRRAKEGHMHYDWIFVPSEFYFCNANIFDLIRHLNFLLGNFKNGSAGFCTPSGYKLFGVGALMEATKGALVGRDDDDFRYTNTFSRYDSLPPTIGIRIHWG